MFNIYTYRAFYRHLAQLLLDQVVENEVVAVVVYFLQPANSDNVQLHRVVFAHFFALPSNYSSRQLITAAVRGRTYHKLHLLVTDATAL